MPAERLRESKDLTLKPMDYISEYKNKLRTADEAVRAVKSGDWVDYVAGEAFPELCDAALSKRRDELWDVKIRGNLTFGPILAAECDPTREHFHYNTWHYSAYERSLAGKGLCSFMPMLFRDLVSYYKKFLTVNVAMLCVCPMDKHGYFNLSCSTGVAKGIIECADIVIVEINETLPKVRGGFDEVVHISDIDYIVEGPHRPLPIVPVIEPTPEDIAIAGLIVPQIPSGATLQLGIGGMPNTVGRLLADSDVKDLGMHTELCTPAYVDLFEAGKLTNARKNINRGKGVASLAFGSKPLYEWIDDNPGIAFCPLSYVNDPAVIAQMDDFISINSCLSADLYGQVSAETIGLRHISGTGGQLDFVTGAYHSKGGRSFLCMTSSYIDKEGKRHSRILPHFGGDIVTDPRTQVCSIVTEFGIAELIGRSSWERAENLISVAHPDFRDGLIAEAEKQGIWRRSNRR